MRDGRNVNLNRLESSEQSESTGIGSTIHYYRLTTILHDSGRFRLISPIPVDSDCSDDSGRFQTIPDDSGRFWKIPDDSGRFWKIPDDSSKFWKIPDNSGEFSDSFSLESESYLPEPERNLASRLVSSIGTISDLRKRK
uniref:Uncharacterized protein n=1 Tax=Anopheles melas TaxID=34690 RepID=A0A182TK07_9DIPT